MTSAEGSSKTVTLLSSSVEERWSVKLSPGFYLEQEAGNIIVFLEALRKIYGREYACMEKYLVEPATGKLTPVEVFDREYGQLYISREEGLWILKKYVKNRVDWYKSFFCEDINVTVIADTVFVETYEPDGGAALLVYRSTTGEELWRLEGFKQTEFFLTPASKDKVFQMIMYAWHNGLNYVTRTPASRLVFLEAASDPLTETESLSQLKDRLYAIDAVNGSILWQEEHDIIETRELSNGVVIETIDSFNGEEVATLRYVKPNGEIKWRRVYSEHIKTALEDNLLVIEREGDKIDIIDVETNVKLTTIENVRAQGITIQRIREGSILLEEYKPSAGRHVFKAVSMTGETIWQIYVAPQRRSALYLGEPGDFAAIQISGIAYILNLVNGQIIRSIKTGRDSALILKPPFLAVVTAEPDTTKIYDIYAGDRLLELKRILREDEIAVRDSLILLKNGDELTAYELKRRTVQCVLPEKLRIRRAATASITIDFKRVDEPVKLLIREAPPMFTTATREIIVEKPGIVELKLKARKDVMPGTYNLGLTINLENRKKGVRLEIPLSIL